MSEIDIRAGGKKRMEEDKLRIPKLLQESQQQFDLKNHKRMYVITVICAIITLVSLLLNVLFYYGLVPKH